MASEDLSLNLLLNAQGLARGAAESVSALQKISAQLTELNDRLNINENQFVKFSKAQTDTARSMGAVSAAAASAKATTVSFSDQIAAGVQKVNGFSTSLFNMGSYATQGMETTRAAMGGIAGAFSGINNALGGTVSKTQAATQTMQFFNQTSASGSGVTIANVGRITSALAQMPAPIRSASGVMLALTGSAGALASTLVGRTGNAAQNFGTRLKAAVNTSPVAKLIAELQKVGQEEDNDSNKGSRLRDALSKLGNVGSSAMKGLGGALKGVVGAFTGMLKNAFQMVVIMQIQQKITEGFQFLIHSVFGFNKQLQEAETTFKTVMGNEVSHAINNQVRFRDASTSAAQAATDGLVNYVANLNKATNNFSGSMAQFNSSITMEGILTKVNALKDKSGEYYHFTKESFAQLATIQPDLFNDLIQQSGVAKDASDAFVNQLKMYANFTPFRFEQLLDSAKRMRAFGFTAAETIPTLRAVGDAVSALGGGADKMNKITYALGQMRNSGRVYQRQMIQLTNAGINAYQILADEMNKKISAGDASAIALQQKAIAAGYNVRQGLTTESIRWLTKQSYLGGKASSEMLIAGMEEQFKGGQDKFMNTMAGASTTIADVVQTTVGTAFKPIFDFVGGNTDGEGALGFIQTLKQRLLDNLGDITKGAEIFANGLQESLSKIDMSKVADGFLMIVGIIIKMTMGLGPFIGTLVNLFVGLATAFGSAAPQIMQFIDAFQAFATSTFALVDQAVNAVIAPLGIVLQNLFSGLTIALGPLTDAVNQISGPLATGIGLVAEGIGVISQLLQPLGVLLGIAFGFLGPIIAGILDGINGILKPILNFIKQMMPGLMGVFNLFNDKLGPIIVFFGKIFGGVFKFIGDSLGFLLQGPLAVLGAVLGAVFNVIGIGINILAAVIEGFVNAVIFALNLFRSDKDKIANVHFTSSGSPAEDPAASKAANDARMRQGIDQLKQQEAAMEKEKEAAAKRGDKATVERLNKSLQAIRAQIKKDSAAVSASSGTDGSDALVKWDSGASPTDVGTGVPVKPTTGSSAKSKIAAANDVFDSKLKAWMDKVKSETKAMYDAQIGKIKEAQDAEKKRYDTVKEAGKRAHEAALRNFDDEHTRQMRNFDDALSSIRKQKEALQDQYKETNAQDDRKKLEQDLAFALAEQASGTKDPLEAAKDVANARAALADHDKKKAQQDAIDALDAQATSIEDQKKLWERDYEDRKLAEQRAYDASLQALEDQHKATMELMDQQQQALRDKMEADLLAFDNHVEALAQKLKAKKITAKEFVKQTKAEFLKLGESYDEIGNTLGLSIAAGLNKSKAAVDKAATELAAIIKKYLGVHSPTEAGPLAVDQSIWGYNLSNNVIKGIKRGFKGDLGMRMGIDMLSDSFKNISPMVPVGAGGGGGDNIVMNFNFAPGSVRGDGDIYALADQLEKRITRTLRQR